MKKIFILASVLISTCLYSQVGIGTDSPKTTLHVVTTSPTNTTIADGFLAPKLTGDELKAKDNLYLDAHKGAIIYATEPISVIPGSGKTVNVIQSGYYYFDGTVWVYFLKPDTTNSNRGTRFIGGTVYARFNSTTSGSPQLDSSKLIPSSYSVGSITVNTPSKGGITMVYGEGYTIANPSNGVFDIKLNIPMDQVYGISTNILDAYGNTASAVSTNTYPQPSTYGSILNTKDNTQISYLSNSTIRIKTGDQNGAVANRPFTFLITGK